MVTGPVLTLRNGKTQGHYSNVECLKGFTISKCCRSVHKHVTLCFNVNVPQTKQHVKQCKVGALVHQMYSFY